MVVPHRPAMLTAKMLSTIDVLANGRLIIGAGAGWMGEEFKLLGAPFEQRGKVTDESLEAFIALWTKDGPVSYHGKHVSFYGRGVLSQAAAEAASAALDRRREPGAFRRVIRFGNVWYPGNNSQTKPLDTPKRLAAGIADVKRMCEAAKRDPASLGVALLVQDFFEWGDYKTQDGSARRMFTGTSADMAADAAPSRRPASDMWPCASAGRRARTRWRASSASAPR